MPKGLISIVVPIYCEKQNLPQLIDRLDSVTSTLQEFRWRYVLVNDGSTDETWDLIVEFARESSRIVGLDLSRNFGKEVALTAGIHHARNSNAVVCIDADLQHPPDLIPQLISRWRDGAEVVEAVRVGNKKEALLRKLGSKLYYWMMSQISDLPVTPNTTDFRLYDQKVVSAFCEYPARSLMFRGIIDWMGFRRSKVEFLAESRAAGQPKYSYRKLLNLAISNLTAYSMWPLKVVGYLGITITTLSGLSLCWMLINVYIFNKLIYTPMAIVIVTNTLLIGVVLIALGLISLYIAAIHGEVSERPLYRIRETVQQKTEQI